LCTLKKTGEERESPPENVCGEKNNFFNHSGITFRMRQIVATEAILPQHVLD
jgi:hypothetical protein